MFSNYLKVVFRNAWRNKGYTVINVAGLAAGVAVCLVIFLWVRHETGFNRFHENADRIYRVVTFQTGQTGTSANAALPTPVEQVLDQMLGVEAVSLNAGGQTVVRSEALTSKESGGFATANLFDVFSFGLTQGNPSTALADPFTVVISQELARKHFGDADPIGRRLQIADEEYQVTGVLAPVPSNSHVQFDFLRSDITLKSLYSESFFKAWFGYSSVYLKLSDGSSPAAAEQRIMELLREIRPENVNPVYEFRLLPLTDLYLHSEGINGIERQGSLSQIYLYVAIATIILLIASINYMNLATARASTRAREIGIRKAIGARRRQLVVQFFTESLFFTGLAFILALLLVEFALPALRQALHVDLDLWRGGFGLWWLAAAIFGVGIVAGSYPAVFLSRPVPVAVLKDQRATGVSSQGRLRKALVVTQFACSTVLIFSTLIVYRQLDFMKSQDLGFNQNHIVTLPMSAMGMDSDRPFKDAILNDTRILDASFSFAKPGVWIPGTPLVGVEGVSHLEPFQVRWISVDYDFLDTFQIELLKGRGFSLDRATDATDAFIVNEAAARALGMENPVGRRLKLQLNNREGEVIGLVRDFNYTSLREPIQPMVLYVSPMGSSTLSVRLQPGQEAEALAFIRSTWEQFYPDRMFEYSFLDESIQRHYSGEADFGRITGGFAVLAVVIACLGLFGLAAFTAEVRTKEIGIRKVMGASVNDIVGLLNKDFLKLVALGFVCAIPMAWYAMDRWLANFAFHVEIGVGTVAAAGLIALLVAFLTVSVQSVKAALVNPVDSLRAE